MWGGRKRQRWPRLGGGWVGKKDKPELWEATRARRERLNCFKRGEREEEVSRRRTEMTGERVAGKRGEERERLKAIICLFGRAAFLFRIAQMEMRAGLFHPSSGTTTDGF